MCIISLDTILMAVHFSTLTNYKGPRPFHSCAGGEKKNTHSLFCAVMKSDCIFPFSFLSAPVFFMFFCLF